MNTLTAAFDRNSLDPEIELVLASGLVKDPVEAQKLLDYHKVSTALELLQKLPPPPGPDYRGRFKRWLMALEGAYETDPHRKEYWESRRRAQAAD